MCTFVFSGRSRMTAAQCLEHAWFRSDDQMTMTSRRLQPIAIDSPAGQRRSLALTSNGDVMQHEPVKKCKCDLNAAAVDAKEHQRSLKDVDVTVVVSDDDVEKENISRLDAAPNSVPSAPPLLTCRDVIVDRLMETSVICTDATGIDAKIHTVSCSADRWCADPVLNLISTPVV